MGMSQEQFDWFKKVVRDPQEDLLRQIVRESADKAPLSDLQLLGETLVDIYSRDFKKGLEQN